MDILMDHHDIFSYSYPRNPRCNECYQHNINNKDLEILEHACQCDGSGCDIRACEFMRCKIFHNKYCVQINIDYCHICKSLISLCYHHEQQCNKNVCSVPFCMVFRERRLHLEKTITPDLRNHAVEMLLEVITTRRKCMPPYHRYHNYCLAKKSENDIFKVAATPKDYYRILGAKKWDIEMGERHPAEIQPWLEYDSIVRHPEEDRIIDINLLDLTNRRN